MKHPRLPREVQTFAIAAMIAVAILAALVPAAPAQARQAEHLDAEREQPVGDTRTSPRPTQPGPTITTPIDVNDNDKPGIVGSASMDLAIKVTLEGPLQTSGLMSTSLADLNLVPGAHPVLGTVMDPAVLARTGDDRLVDWVRVQIREVDDPSVIVADIAAVLEADGDVMSATVSGQRPSIAVSDGAYYVMVRHQSHLPALSPVLVPTSGVLDFDFTEYGGKPDPASSNQKELAAGGFAMFAGNADQTTDARLMDINLGDKILYSAEAGMFGQYLATDFNMNGSVDGADHALWIPNNGIFGLYPFSGAAQSGGVVINEVDPNHPVSDWVELHNPSDLPLDISGYVLKNAGGAQTIVAAGTTLLPGGYVTLSFALQESGDTVDLYFPGGATVIDSHTWISDATESGVTTWGRCQDGIGGQFLVTALLSPGASNICDG